MRGEPTGDFKGSSGARAAGHPCGTGHTTIVACGVDWETAALAERERCAAVANRAHDIVAHAMSFDGIRGVVLLRTCNRFEWYADVEQGVSTQDVAAELMGVVGLPSKAPSLFSVSGRAAVSRLMEIASGVRSQILGEDQIISQVREAQKEAREAHVMTPVLETLFRMAVTAGKAVRTKVKFHAVPASSARKAVELVEERLGGLEGKRALVIGNGEMGRLAAELLIGAGASTRITLRSYRHGQTTVPAGCATVPYEERARAIGECDVLVSATKSPHCTVTESMLSGLENRPAIIVDMAIPRDVEEGCGNFDDVELLDMDDLKDDVSDARSPQIALARSIIERYIGDFEEWQRNRDLHLATVSQEKRRREDALAAPATAFDSRALPDQDDTAFPYGRFPLFVDLTGAVCVVVGGGPVGVRRARALARYGAQVTLIAPAVSEEVEGIRVLGRSYREGDMSGAFIAVAATDDRAVNHAVALECAREGIPVSVSDCPEECTFFFPALCESRDLVAGVVSRGNRHALTARAAQAIRETLQEVDR